MKTYISLFLALAAAAGVLLAEPDKTPPEPPVHPDHTVQSVKAITKGLDFLNKRLSNNGGYGENYPVATTSLVGLAFLAGGNIPGEGKYGDALKAVTKYLLRSQDETGYIIEPDKNSSSRMHGHGFATWFLAEIYGMTKSTSVDKEQIKSALRQAVKVIETSQSRDGGWYYEPRPSGDEGSVTVCIVQALRAARNVGIAVDKNVINSGIEYLRQTGNEDGSFRYSLHSSRSESSFALAAGGVSSLCLYGKFDAAETQRGLKFLMGFKPGTPNNWKDYPYYSNFYGTLAMHLAGEQYWPQWFPPLRDYFVGKQDLNGSWSGGEGGTNIDYATAFACLTLQIPYQYLPLFQK
ncbi:MAG: prenyltransferase/squalene oxidase repeat-containing protein [Candidatus Brocadiia bacterium]